jgi:hypothetical protein
MCLSQCLICLPHYPSDPLSLGLFPLLQCLSSLPIPLSFAQTRLYKQKSKDKTERDQHRPHPTKQDPTRVRHPFLPDFLRLVLPVLPVMTTLPRPQTMKTSPLRRFAPSYLCRLTPFLPCVSPLPLSPHFVSRTTLLVCLSLFPCLSCRLSLLFPSLSLHLLPPSWERCLLSSHLPHLSLTPAALVSLSSFLTSLRLPHSFLASLCLLSPSLFLMARLYRSVVLPTSPASLTFLTNSHLSLDVSFQPQTCLILSSASRLSSALTGTLSSLIYLVLSLTLPLL